MLDFDTVNSGRFVVTIRKKHTASFLREQAKTKTIFRSDTMVAFYQNTWRRQPAEQIPKRLNNSRTMVRNSLCQGSERLRNLSCHLLKDTEPAPEKLWFQEI